MNPSEQPSGSTVEYTLGRIDGKIDMILAQNQETKLRLDDQDSRISSLEKGRAMLMGGAAVVSAAVTAVGAFFVR